MKIHRGLTASVSANLLEMLAALGTSRVSCFFYGASDASWMLPDGSNLDAQQSSLETTGIT